MEILRFILRVIGGELGIERQNHSQGKESTGFLGKEGDRTLIKRVLLFCFCCFIFSEIWLKITWGFDIEICFLASVLSLAV